MEQVKRTTPDRVGRIHYRVLATNKGRADGYGQTPTGWLVKYTHDNGKAWWHRVYALCYGNGSSLVIKSGGENLFIDTETEQRLTEYRELTHSL